MDTPLGLLDTNAPVQAMKKLHKVNHYTAGSLGFFISAFVKSK